MTIRRRQSSNEIHSDVRPGLIGERQGAQLTSWRLMGQLAVGTNGVGRDKGSSVTGHGGHPEALTDEV